MGQAKPGPWRILGLFLEDNPRKLFLWVGAGIRGCFKEGGAEALRSPGMGCGDRIYQNFFFCGSKAFFPLYYQEWDDGTWVTTCPHLFPLLRVFLTPHQTPDVFKTPPRQPLSQESCLKALIQGNHASQGESLYEDTRQVSPKTYHVKEKGLWKIHDIHDALTSSFKPKQKTPQVLDVSCVFDFEGPKKTLPQTSSPVQEQSQRPFRLLESAFWHHLPRVLKHSPTFMISPWHVMWDLFLASKGPFDKDIPLGISPSIFWGQRQGILGLYHRWCEGSFWHHHLPELSPWKNHGAINKHLFWTHNVHEAANLALAYHIMACQKERQSAKVSFVPWHMSNTGHPFWWQPWRQWMKTKAFHLASLVGRHHTTGYLGEKQDIRRLFLTFDDLFTKKAFHLLCFILWKDCQNLETPLETFSMLAKGSASPLKKNFPKKKKYVKKEADKS